MNEPESRLAASPEVKKEHGAGSAAPMATEGRDASRIALAHAGERAIDRILSCEAPADEHAHLFHVRSRPDVDVAIPGMRVEYSVALDDVPAAERERYGFEWHVLPDPSGADRMETPISQRTTTSFVHTWAGKGAHRLQCVVERYDGSVYDPASKVVERTRTLKVVRVSDLARELVGVSPAERNILPEARGVLDRLTPGSATPVRAVYINDETGNKVALPIYFGVAADHRKVVGRRGALEEGRLLLDLSPGARKREILAHDFGEAIAHFSSDNDYPKGTIVVADPFTGKETVLRTTGESTWAKWASISGMASLALLAAAGVAVVASGGTAAVPLLYLSMAAGRASAVLSLEDHLQEDQVSLTKVGIDVVNLASTYTGLLSTLGANAPRTISIGGKAFMVFQHPASTAQLALGGVDAILISAEYKDELAKIANGDTSKEETMNALVPFLTSLATAGLMMGVGTRGAPPTARRATAVEARAAASVAEPPANVRARSVAAAESTSAPLAPGLPYDAAWAAQHPKLARRISKLVGGRDAPDAWKSDTPPETIAQLAPDPEVAAGLLAVHDQLGDKAAFGVYYARLLKETVDFVEAAAARPWARPRRSNLVAGKLHPWDIQQVLVNRIKARGLRIQPVSRLLTPGLFRDTLRRGPFVDWGFDERPQQTSGAEAAAEVAVGSAQEEGHKAFSHLLQLDYVYDALARATHGQVTKMFEFFGTPEGLKAWELIFDAPPARANGAHSPELLQGYLMESGFTVQ
jgi:hypothetical protein